METGDFALQDVKKIMSGWTRQMGFPVVHVKAVGTEGSTRTLELRQERFIIDGGADTANSQWMVGTVGWRWRCHC